MKPEESMVISEAVDAVIRFCSSTAEIDKLHAKALEELTGLVRNLHDRALALEERLAVVERRFQENVTIDYTTPPGTFVRTKVSQSDPAASLKTPNWEKKL